MTSCFARGGLSGSRCVRDLVPRIRISTGICPLKPLSQTAELPPGIRLKPPGAEGGSDWFLELLGAPDTKSAQDKTFHRVPTRLGHFAICSFTGAGTGLRELMASDGDRSEALSICNKGLLPSMEVGREAFEATGRRLIQWVIEPLAEAASTWR